MESSGNVDLLESSDRNASEIIQALINSVLDNSNIAEEAVNARHDMETKLMQLEVPNRMVDDSDSKAIYIDCRIIVDWDSNDLIESTILIFD